MQLTLTSSIANGYRWSKGATKQSIIISAGGNYFVNAYNCPNCFAKSDIQTITLRHPVLPVITAHGSLTLTLSQSSVILRSSVSNSYLWSTSEVTRAITVNTQGTFEVTVTDEYGCTATSDIITVKKLGCIPPPIPEITPERTTLYMGDQEINLTSSLAAEYLWSNGATTNFITISNEGTYFVRVYNGANCFSTSMPVFITLIPYESNKVKYYSEIVGVAEQKKPLSHYFRIL